MLKKRDVGRYLQPNVHIFYLMKYKRFLLNLVSVLLLLILVENAFASQSDTSAIKFGDLQWQTIRINNAIAMFIIEHGYGYPVESVMLSTPVMQASLPKGDIDVSMEMWRYNIIDWYNEVISKGTVLDLGTLFETATEGWYVPRYVVEGDAERGIMPMAPDLVSVFDLPKYKSLFKDPENPDKGLFLNAIMGWKASEISRVKLHAYGLADDFNIMEPGTTPALDTAIVSAYKKGQPILAYYWEPTWLMGGYDMIQLKEPEHTKACWAQIQKILDNDLPLSKVTQKAGCAFPNYAITKGVYAGLKERAPEIVAFLEKMNVGTVPLNKTAAYMEKEEVEAEQAARWFFENYPDKWRSWLPENIVVRVEKTLAQPELEKDSHQLSDYYNFPTFIKIPLAQWTDDLVKWLIEEWDEAFEVIGNILLRPLLLLERLLVGIPWFLIIIAITVIAWRWGGWQLSFWSVGGLLLIGMLGLWVPAMSTLAIVIAATLLAVFIGVPVGIAMSQSDWFERMTRPMLDMMQTMPSFVYLIPTLMLFGLGKVPALISTVVYAIPPVTRFTNLGIRQVPTQMLEAGHAFGSTTGQLLFKVQLPLAMPTIMAGVNQTVMMALSMVVICSMIGAGGLGNEVLIGINQLKVGRGFTGGIAIVILAIIIDRLTQAFVTKQQQTLKKG